MAMMAYKASMWMICFNFAMGVMVLLGTLIFPQYATTIAPMTISYTYLTSLGGMSVLAIAGTAIAAFVFGFLALTVAFVIALFSISGGLTLYYLSYLNLPAEIYYPITILISIIYVSGVAQYIARSSFQGS